MQGELFGACTLIGLFAALIGLAEILARRTAMAPEWTRKLVHLGGGLGCLLFPLLVVNPLTVLVLALCFGGIFWIGERRRWLLCLCRVSRQSRGSVYYPFAIAVLFWLTAERYGLYLSAVLVLTVSDTAAALVGSRYGRIRYRTGGVDDHKSLEGSLIFWLLSFLAVWIPLVLWGEANLGQALLSAFLTATMLTMVEAVSIGGRDNLYIPLLASFMLLKVVSKPVAELVLQSASMVLLFGVLIALNRYGRLLRSNALMIMGILVYGIWSLGSVDWAVPLVAAFAGFALVFIASGMAQKRTRVYRRMAVLSAPAAALTLAANLTGAFSFLYGPFLVAVLVPLVWGVVMQLHVSPAPPSWRWSLGQSGAALGATLLVLAEPVLMHRAPDAIHVAVLASGAGLAAWIGIGLTSKWSRFSGGTAVLATTCAAILITAGGQATGGLSCWKPSLWAEVYDRNVDVMFPIHPAPAGQAGAAP